MEAEKIFHLQMYFSLGDLLPTRDTIDNPQKLSLSVQQTVLSGTSGHFFPVGSQPKFSRLNVDTTRNQIEEIPPRIKGQCISLALNPALTVEEL